MENHHFSWENSIYNWWFSIAILVYQRVTPISLSFMNVYDTCRVKRKKRNSCGPDIVWDPFHVPWSFISLRLRSWMKIIKKPSSHRWRSLLVFFGSGGVDKWILKVLGWWLWLQRSCNWEINFWINLGEGILIGHQQWEKRGESFTLW